jgi:hypothetical protein
VSRRVRAVAVGLACLGLLVGCGLPADDAVHTVKAQDVPYGLLEPPPTPTPAASSATAKRESQPELYLLGADQLLVGVPAGLEADVRPLPTSQRLVALLGLLETGPTDQQRAQGLGTALTPGVTIRLVSLSDGMAEVQVVASLKDPSADRLPLAVGQLVLTATSLPGVDAVRLLRDGVAAEVPLPGGALTAEPLRRSDYTELVAPEPSASPTR